MGESQQSGSLTPEGKVIDPEYEDTKQIPVHVSKYQYEYMVRKRAVDDFNFSKFVRSQLDRLIRADSVDIPDECLITPEERADIEDGGINVFLTDDD